MSEQIRRVMKDAMIIDAHGKVVGPVAFVYGAYMYAAVRDDARILMARIINPDESWESTADTSFPANYLALVEQSTLHGRVDRDRLLTWAQAEAGEPEVARPDCVSCDNKGWLECLQCSGEGCCTCECGHDHDCAECRGAGKNPCYCGRKSAEKRSDEGKRPGSIGDVKWLYDRTLLTEVISLAPEGPISVLTSPDRRFSGLLILAVPQQWYFFVMPLDYGRAWDQTHKIEHLEVV